MGNATPEIHDGLRVLIANEQHERLQIITRIVLALGHEVAATDTSVANVGSLSRSTGADVALVALGLDSDHALDQITEIVHEAACPVIALLDAEDPSYVTRAAARGVFAHVVLNGREAAELQGDLDITLRRFAEYQSLEGAFSRRAAIEQAKGILMERNGINADAAFELLKAHSQRSGRKLSQVAEAITQSHQLLPSREDTPNVARHSSQTSQLP